MFADRVRIMVRAGNGGNGVVSFRREKFVPRGGPDGGDGGDGGQVILRVDDNVDHLKSFQYDPKLVAQDGGHGSGGKRHGKNGKTKIGRVPPGTLIYKTDALTVSEAAEMERSEEGLDAELVADLTELGEEFVLCKGGKGGKGNWHFRTSTNQTPQEHTLGTEAESGIYYMELRRIADAGMVGFPNAGKSTLTGALSAAKPKVANYPFTTLAPMVGVCEFEGYRRCTVADIPGLIEGAHENRGLGHEFLRHITRCSTLLFVVDMSGVEGRDPIEDLQALRTEIKLYDEDVAKLDWMIVANKMDEPNSEENLGYLKARFPKQLIIPISAKEGDGIEDLKKVLDEKVGQDVK